MDPKLVEAYTNGILLSEKKHHGDARPLGDKGSKLQSKGGSVVKHAKAREFDLEKDVKLTAALKGSGTSRVKGLKSPQKLSDSYTGYSKFDSIFKKALMEELDEQPVPADVEGSEVDADPGDVVEPSTVEASEGEGEGDIVSDLQDVVSKLNDILSTLGAGEEEEEEEVDDVNNEIDQVEGPTDEVPAAPGAAGVAESLSDLKGAILKLKTGLHALTSKKNVVSSKLKVAKGKAAVGDLAGKPLAMNTSLQSKGNMHVQTKLKPGHGLFERRRG
jgi:hypothetical protein